MNEEKISAAWWCAVAEPGDEWAGALRAQLGGREAMQWVLNGGPLPNQLLWQTPGEHAQNQWEKTRLRWLPRAQEANPQEDLRQLEVLHGHFLVPGDDLWPAHLEELDMRQPCALWILGDPTALRKSEVGVSIVGARACSSYGQHTTANMAMDLADQHIGVVSGGAFGIDIAAHRGALSAQGVTVAFMAGGVGNLYPRSHVEDLHQIAQNGGAVVSEVPPSWRPAKWRFLGRNRLIAALTSATVVVEAGIRSGALATARAAMSLGRHVGAVPGLLTSSQSAGCHDLIRNGATLIRDAGDVTEMIQPVGQRVEELFGAPVTTDQGVDALPPDQRRLWEALPRKGSMSRQELTRVSGLSEEEAWEALVRLQLSGLVVSDGTGWMRGAADSLT